MSYRSAYKKLFNPLLYIGLALFMMACQPVRPNPADVPQSPLSPLNSPLATPASAVAPDEDQPDGVEKPVEAEPMAEDEAEPAEYAPKPTATPEPEAVTPLPEDEPRRPRMLNIPAIGLRTIIQPMGWTVTEVRGERTTKWVVPGSGVGWHINSAGVGNEGNMILSGHQSVGGAVLAPIALGDVAEGQEILISDLDGATFAYEVIEVSKPVPIIGATDADKALAQSYVAQPEADQVAQLTLITGWPDFTTTHRIFVVAQYVGPADN